MERATMVPAAETAAASQKAVLNADLAGAQGPVKVEICPIRTTDALASISGGRQLARGVGRAR
jgi:hypothetical protein